MKNTIFAILVFTGIFLSFTSTTTNDLTSLGDIKCSLLDYESFKKENGTNWIPMSGQSIDGSDQSIPATALFRSYGVKSVPNLNSVINRVHISEINSGSIKHAKKIHEVIPTKDGLTSTWHLGLRDIRGQRYINNWEQDEDHFQVFIRNNSAIAQGRTFNWKHNKWGQWRGGVANYLNVQHQSAKYYYYIKVNK